jgi:hypothetical protein
LIAEAMAEHTSRLTVDLKGDWRAVTRRIRFALRDFMSDPTELALGRFMPLSDSAELLDIVARQWGKLWADMAQPLEEAQQRGAIRKDADIQMILLSLSSTMLTLTIYTRRKPSDTTAERLAKQAIRGMKP